MNMSTPATRRPRAIWLTLEAQEIVELKQAMLDRDAQEAADLFRRVVPRVQQAAHQRGIAVEPTEQTDGRLP